MTTIIGDERQCGEGKTYDGSPTAIKDKGRILSIYSNIKDGWSVGQKYLVVLPSKALIEDYRCHLQEHIDQEAKNLFGGFDKKQLAAITSDQYDNVQQQLHEELNDHTPIIVISHQAFLYSSIEHSQRMEYNLIIDEAFMPYKEIAVYHAKDCNVDFKWSENIELIEPQDNAVEWPELRFFDLQGNFITDTAEHTRHLFSENWRCRVNVEDYEKFAGPIPKNKKVSVIQELRPEILASWHTIWIACAAFKYTFMYYWMDLHAIPYKAHHKLKFNTHKIPLNILGPEDKFVWSSYKQQNEETLIEQYKTQVEPKAGANGVLILRNNSQKRQIFDNEERLPHNSAGGNKWRNFEYISLESALNPTPTMSRFLYDVYGIGKERLDKVHIAQTVYTFYQTIMRSCLRDGKPATVFCLDNRVVLGLSEFFDNITYEEIRLVRPDVNPVGRPIKANRLTNAQQQKCQRRRTKMPELQGKSNEEIWAMLMSGEIK